MRDTGDDPRTVHRSNEKGVNVHCVFLLSCCGCVGGLVLASVVVWLLVLVSVSRVVAWSFPPALGFLGGTFVDGRRPKNRAQLGFSGASVRQAGTWYGGARMGDRMGDRMGLVERCLFLLFSIPLLIAYPNRVSFSSCHLEGIRWKYQYGTTRREVLDATRKLWRTVGSTDVREAS